MLLGLLHQISVVTVRDLIKMADVQWISETIYDTDDLGLDCKLGGANGLMLY